MLKTATEKKEIWSSTLSKLANILKSWPRPFYTLILAICPATLAVQLSFLFLHTFTFSYCTHHTVSKIFPKQPYLFSLFLTEVSNVPSITTSAGKAIPPKGALPGRKYVQPEERAQQPCNQQPGFRLGYAYHGTALKNTASLLLCCPSSWFWAIFSSPPLMEVSH